MRGLVLVGALLASAILGGCAAAGGPGAPPGPLPLSGAVLAHARAIYSRGATLGERPDVFAKVGDSNTASGTFMEDVGCGRARLGRYRELAATLRFFTRRRLPRGYVPFLFASQTRCPTNSFVRIGFAAHPGWGVQNLLQPFEQLPGFLTLFDHRFLIGAHPAPGRRVVAVEGRPAGRCAKGSGAVACELSAIRPSVAFVMIGTNDVPALRLPQFERRLRRVVEVLIRAGTVPVLSTIPPLRVPGASGRIAAINGVVTALATQERLPLWDLHTALERPGMVNQGLRPDGTHLSVYANRPADFTGPALRYGMNLRNLQALEILDLLRREVLTAPAQALRAKAHT